MVFLPLCLCLHVLTPVQGAIGESSAFRTCASLTHQLECLVKGQIVYRRTCQVLFLMCETKLPAVCFPDLKQQSTEDQGPFSEKNSSKALKQETKRTSQHGLLVAFMNYPLAIANRIYDVHSERVSLFLKFPRRLTAVASIKSERKLLASTVSDIYWCDDVPCQFRVFIKSKSTNSFAVDEKKHIMFFFSASGAKIVHVAKEQIVFVRMTTSGKKKTHLLNFYGHLLKTSIAVDPVNSVLYVGLEGNSLARYKYNGVVLSYITTSRDDVVLSLYNNEHGMHLYYTRNMSLYKWSSSKKSEKLFSNQAPFTYAVEVDDKLFFTLSNSGHVYIYASGMELSTVRHMSVVHKDIGIIAIP